MFDDVKQAFHDLLNGNVSSQDRRDLLQEMRATLVQAKMAVEDLREGVRTTEKRLTRERAELETVQRRRMLAEGINDAETIAVAQRFETQHLERVALLEKKLDAEQGELALVERDIEEMTAQFKAAQAGVGSGLRAGQATEDEDLINRDASLDRELSGLDRAQRRAAHEAEADARLAELKRRMGL